jgi:hypothetical protein
LIRPKPGSPPFVASFFWSAPCDCGCGPGVGCAGSGVESSPTRLEAPALTRTGAPMPFAFLSSTTPSSTSTLVTWRRSTCTVKRVPRTEITALGVPISNEGAPPTRFCIVTFIRPSHKCKRRQFVDEGCFKIRRVCGCTSTSLPSSSRSRRLPSSLLTRLSGGNTCPRVGVEEAWWGSCTWTFPLKSATVAFASGASEGELCWMDAGIAAPLNHNIAQKRRAGLRIGVFIHSASHVDAEMDGVNEAEARRRSRCCLPARLFCAFFTKASKSSREELKSETLVATSLEHCANTSLQSRQSRRQNTKSLKTLELGIYRSAMKCFETTHKIAVRHYTINSS